MRWKQNSPGGPKSPVPVSEEVPEKIRHFPHDVSLGFFQQEQASLEAALRASKEAAASEAAAAAGLRKELAAMPSVAEVKGLRLQLRVLQQLEFNADIDADEDGVS